MHRLLKALGAAFLAIGLVSMLASNGTRAAAGGKHDGSSIGQDMVGRGGMMDSHMGRMMEHCNKMMQGMADGGAGRPNEQWRKEAPAAPEKKD